MVSLILRLLGEEEEPHGNQMSLSAALGFSHAVALRNAWSPGAGRLASCCALKHLNFAAAPYVLAASSRMVANMLAESARQGLKAAQLSGDPKEIQLIASSLTANLKAVTIQGSKKPQLPASIASSGCSAARDVMALARR